MPINGSSKDGSNIGSDVSREGRLQQTEVPADGCEICRKMRDLVGQIPTKLQDTVKQKARDAKSHTFNEECELYKVTGVQSIEEFRTYIWLMSKGDDGLLALDVRYHEDTPKAISGSHE